MADVGHGVNVFRRYRFFQPEQAERLKLFCYSLCCPRVVAAMHVASESHPFGNGCAHMLDPAHHPVNLGVVGSPVHPVEAVRIGGTGLPTTPRLTGWCAGSSMCANP